MPKRRGQAALAFAIAAAMGLVPPVAAQSPAAATPQAAQPVNPALQRRVDAIVAVLNGMDAPADYFSDSFRTLVPPERFAEIAASITGQFGAPLRVQSFRADSDLHGTAEVEFARAVGKVQIAIEPGTAARVSGFLVSDLKLTGDTPDQIFTEIKALDGQSSVGVFELSNDEPRLIAGHDADQSLAVASQFKLYILAELGAQVLSGQRKWGDVVTDLRRSFSSPATQNWPQGAPVTLHTLATWMIASSDNGATDTLIAQLGRPALEARVRSSGHAAPAKMTPFLSTVETFALKMPVNDALRLQFITATEAEQARMITAQANNLTLAQVQGHAFAGKPLHIDTVEWFASARDMARLMQGLTGPDAATERAIMAVNPGIAPTAAARWPYLGYKGGSESGVLAMGFLLRHRDGRWLCIQGAWNDTAAPVDEAKFAGLMQRLLTYYAD